MVVAARRHTIAILKGLGLNNRMLVAHLIPSSYFKIMRLIQLIFQGVRDLGTHF